ncbi:MAG: GSCFA domain-containing protein [Saprospiraceae bacterium]|nr:GSCFA domain-containing protein [Saprospiraceae bacterium]
MEFRTELNIPISDFKIGYNDPILMLGSCFSQHIGERLQYYKFKCNVNPFGTIFNPVSIAKLITYVSNCTSVLPDELILSHGIYVHPDFHSVLSDENEEMALIKINSAIAETNTFMKQARFVFLTPGTSVAYKSNKTGAVVANCHKLPASNFTKINIGIQEGVNVLIQLINDIHKINPDIKIIFTVSPVRHTKEGLIQNARSKARLINMVELIQSEYNEIAYFPSFEWMMDDLRDYRYYDADLIHPNETAINYIWEKFCTHYFSDETNVLLKEIKKIKLAVGHKPFSKNSNDFKEFCTTNLNEIHSLKSRYPNLDFDHEISWLNAYIS